MQSNQSPKTLDSKLKQELEPLLFRNDYYVDVRDMSGSWIVGKIIEVNNEELTLKIRMEGTKQEIVNRFFFKNTNSGFHKKNMFFFGKKKFKFNSERIAPFRLFTKSEREKMGFI